MIRHIISTWQEASFPGEPLLDVLLPYFLASVLVHEARHTYDENTIEALPRRSSRPDPNHVHCNGNRLSCHACFEPGQNSAWSVNGAYGWAILWWNVVISFPEPLDADPSTDALIRRFASHEMYRILYNQIVRLPG